MAYVAPTFRNNNTPAINETNLNNLAKAVESLGVANGGTGKNSITSGAIVLGDGTDPLDELIGSGAVYATESGNPQFGTLPVSCGGTGVANLASLASKIGIIIISETQPSDTSGNRLWINPTDSSASYYYNGQWRKIVGVFGG